MGSSNEFDSRIGFVFIHTLDFPSPLLHLKWETHAVTRTLDHYTRFASVLA